MSSPESSRPNTDSTAPPIRQRRCVLARRLSFPPNFACILIKWTHAELDKERTTLEAQVSKVEQEKNEVKLELAKAKEKKQEAEAYIAERVASAKKEIQIQSNQSLKKRNKK